MCYNNKCRIGLSYKRSKFAHHRLGCYVDSFNNDAERAEVKELTKLAYINKEIDLSQFLLINAIDSPKKAGMVLAYEKRRLEKLKMQETQQAHENNMQREAQINQNKIDQVTVEKNLENQGKHIQGQYQVRVAQINKEADLEKKAMDIDSIEDKANAKARADKEKQQNKADLQQQASF